MLLLVAFSRFFCDGGCSGRASLYGEEYFGTGGEGKLRKKEWNIALHCGVYPARVEIETAECNN